MELTGRVLHPGTGRGPLLALSAPLSFWGGVDARTGAVADPRHPDHGERLTGRVLVMERTVGSSSSSAIMLEMLRLGTAPAAVVVGEPDAILILGVWVAEELGYPTIPCLETGKAAARRLAGQSGRPAEVRGARLRVSRESSSSG